MLALLGHLAAVDVEAAASARAVHSGLVTGGAGGKGVAKTWLNMLSAKDTTSGCEAA